MPKIAWSSNPWPLPGLPLPPLQINIDSCIIQCYPSVAARTVTTALIYLLFNISSIKLLMCIEASTTYRTGGWSRRIFTRGQTVTAESEFEREKNYQFPQKKGYTTSFHFGHLGTAILKFMLYMWIDLFFFFCFFFLSFIRGIVFQIILRLNYSINDGDRYFRFHRCMTEVQKWVVCCLGSKLLLFQQQ